MPIAHQSRLPRADADAAAPDGRATIWTIGYEGRSVDGLVAELKAAGVAQLVDVRELPLSRKPGFSKSALAAAVEAGGLRYVGERRLGAPREARHRLREGGAAAQWASFAQEYRDHLDSQGDALASVEALARTAPTALLCYERDARECHRGLLAGRLARRGLDVIHL